MIKRHVVFVLFSLLVVGGCVLVLFTLLKIQSPTPSSEVSDADEVPTYVVTFTLNVQDFHYPDLSASLLERLVEAHEQRNIPVEVFLTTTMVDVFSEDYPGLWQQLVTSPVVDISYHIRPPVPYHPSAAKTIDWASLSSDAASDIVYTYETHGLDLVTGEPTEEEGSVAKLTSLLGRPPTCVGASAAVGAANVVHQVFADLGIRCIVDNQASTNLGDRRGGFWVRPQHVDVKLFAQLETPAEEILAQAKQEAVHTEGFMAPYFLNVKMHDNDFFAEDSAWTTVYLAPGARRNGPPYDLSVKSLLLSAVEQEEVYEAYVSMLNTALADPEILMMNLPQVEALLP